MLLQGIAGQPQDSSYTGKDKVEVKQWRFDLLDDTAGTIPVQLPFSIQPPTRGQDVIVEVQQVRTIAFGVGFVMVGKGWKPNTNSTLPLKKV